ncbi:MAG: DMT family transporter [Variibacter sp.]|nr:DMT family transporter [Variibacter sp.]
MSQARANRRGIIAVTIATAGFSGNDAIVKLVARDYPLGEVIFVRGLMTCLLVGTVLALLGHFGSVRFAWKRVVLARSGFEALSTLFFTSALVHMPLAALSTIILVAPLILTALSVLLFKEAVGWRRWAAIAVGFAGTLFVVKPTPGAFDAWALLGLACACTSAGRDLLTRRLPPGTPSLVVSFGAAVAVTLVGAAMGFWEQWRPMAWPGLALLALAAVSLAAANFFMVLAYRGVEIAAVAPFRYCILLWAGLAGYFVFGEVPDRWSAVGAALIVASGLYALHREAVRAREAAVSAADAAAERGTPGPSAPEASRAADARH